MTTLIIQIESAKTTLEINRIMWENLRHFNSCTILDFIARQSRRRIKHNDEKFSDLIFKN